KKAVFAARNGFAPKNEPTAHCLDSTFALRHSTFPTLASFHTVFTSHPHFCPNNRDFPAPNGFVPKNEPTARIQRRTSRLPLPAPGRGQASFSSRGRGAASPIRPSHFGIRHSLIPPYAV